MDRGDFYREPGDLQGSGHPVKWLQIRLLVARANTIGLADVAHEIEEDWALGARTMSIPEDYPGFYDHSFSLAVTRTLDAMVAKVQPRCCTESEAKGDSWDGSVSGLVRLLNPAWQIYKNSPSAYAAWEKEAPRQLLGEEFVRSQL